MITLTDIKLERGSKTLLANTSVTFYDRQRIGVIGRNGCGKTSLFLLLLRNITASDGELHLSPKLNLVTVDQETPRGIQTALSYVIDADQVLRGYEEKLRSAEQEQQAEKIGEIYEHLLCIDGFTAEARAAKILKGLGFADMEMAESVNSLSGGWQMRLNIARALFVPSDVLLLDEPTNHLDLDAVIWLEKWLQKYNGLLLIISHDRDFLDKVVTHIAHFDQQDIKLYTGNYETFERQYAENLALQQKMYVKQQQHISHIESYIQRFRAKATKARQAQSRIKALEKMQRIAPAHVDSPFSFAFHNPRSIANPMLKITDVDFSYDDNLVYQHLNLQIISEDRIGLLGRNGAGKSTLIKLLAKDIQPQHGVITYANKLTIGYFAQHSLDNLDHERSALQHLSALASDRTDTQLRQFLGGFAFSGDATLMPVKNFSGGEKARLALALIVWQGPSILLLDEPTNHLDIEMRQALIIALQNYMGAVIVVSHDRFLLQQVVDEYWFVNDKKVEPFLGSLEEYQKLVLSRNADQRITQNNQELSNKKKTELRKRAQVFEGKIVRVQKNIVELEEKMAQLSGAPQDNIAMINDLHMECAQMQKHAQILEDEWLTIIEQTD
ncbi:MAG: ATP-binding cassette domain-containing protein [Gammaproteobacteria bacterium]|nr:ATP-binding cassette domain-containing protein [Gammaproteobacteria bacterium]